MKSQEKQKPKLDIALHALRAYVGDVANAKRSTAATGVRISARTWAKAIDTYRNIEPLGEGYAQKLR
jgi:hypothetical protein